jgi:hypothetical protein
VMCYYRVSVLTEAATLYAGAQARTVKAHQASVPTHARAIPNPAQTIARRLSESGVLVRFQTMAVVDRPLARWYAVAQMASRYNPITATLPEASGPAELASVRIARAVDACASVG